MKRLCILFCLLNLPLFSMDVADTINRFRALKSKENETLRQKLVKDHFRHKGDSRFLKELLSADLKYLKVAIRSGADVNSKINNKLSLAQTAIFAHRFKHFVFLAKAKADLSFFKMKIDKASKQYDRLYLFLITRRHWSLIDDILKIRPLDASRVFHKIISAEVDLPIAKKFYTTYRKSILTESHIWSRRSHYFDIIEKLYSDHFDLFLFFVQYEKVQLWRSPCIGIFQEAIRGRDFTQYLKGETRSKQLDWLLKQKEIMTRLNYFGVDFDLKKLIKLGFNINVLNSNQNTYLDYLLRKRKKDHTPTLMKKITLALSLGATTKEALDKNIFHYAANDQLQALKDELSKSANINKPNSSSWTPLHFTAQNPKSHCLKFLIAKGADLDLKNNLGWTALHLAAYYNNIKNIKALIEARANKTIKSRLGLTPYDLALKRGYKINTLK